MLSSLRNPISNLLRPSGLASSSRHVLPALPSSTQIRYRSSLAPKRTKHKKAMKGMPISLPTGGSIRGTTLSHGTYGIRLLQSARLSAEQLTAAQNAIRRKIKAVKGAVCWLKVFPDIPVCVKGNEVRMGKGKGSFEFWACRVPMGRVVFEVGGGGIREEIAKQALKVAQDRLPVRSEFITVNTPARLGDIVSNSLEIPAAARIIPAALVEMDTADQGRVADVLDQEGSRLDEVFSGLTIPAQSAVEVTA